jgi:DHA1 family chloramphenicol resistance protein-like MFS transporter
VLGRYFGWRAAFWAVAIVSLPALIAIVRSVSSRTTSASTIGPIRVRPRLVVLLVLGALVNGATFCSFTYLAPVVTEVTELGVGWVPLMLALFGLGSFVGVTIAGLFADRRDYRLTLVAGGILLAGWCAFALTAKYVVPTVVLVLLQGGLSFAVGSTLIAYTLYAGSDSPVLTGGLATAALNVGAAVGPVLGGVAIGAVGFRGPLWVSVALVGAAGCVGGGSVRLGDREGLG